jgi:hypothetical protein
VPVFHRNARARRGPSGTTKNKNTWYYGITRVEAVGAILVIALLEDNMQPADKTYRRANTRFAPATNRTRQFVSLLRGRLKMLCFQVKHVKNDRNADVFSGLKQDSQILY